jgi:hypothetical protein
MRLGTFIGTLLFLSLVLSSCRTAKIAAVSCPEFSRNKNNKIAADNKRNRNKAITAHYRVNIRKQPVDRLAEFPRKDLGKDIVVFNNSSIKENIIVPGIDRVSGLSKIEYLQGLTASINNEIIPLGRDNITALSLNKIDMTEHSEHLIINQPAGCDTIVLKSGSVVICQVTEVGQNAINYRRCGNLDGPIISILISDISVIKYSNGTSDFFKIPNVTAYGENVLPRRIEWFGLTGFVLSLVGLVGLIGFGMFVTLVAWGLIGIIFGGISQFRIKRHPGRYKWKRFARVSIFMGLIDIIVFIGFIAFVLFLMSL